jgi:hypothetical protein
MILFLLLIILILIIFYLTEKYILKRNFEYFEKLNNGLLCGTEGNVCSVDDYKTNSCCKGFDCIRPNGNYHNKICVDSSKNNIFDGVIKIPELNGVLNKKSFNDMSNSAKNAFSGIGKDFSDIGNEFSGLGSFFPELKINLGDACKK